MGIIRSLRLPVIGTLLVLMLLASVSSFAGVFVSVGFGPPALPVYEQPLCPAAGYIWTPGYWAYGPGGYFWVPGTWVIAPQPGLLWTPGYWGWGEGAYLWHGGYWGPTVGFYGGINYGFGYGGFGYQGGYWRNREFFYNRTVNNVNVTNVTNVYNTTVVNNNNHVAFNGGQGGIQARPTPTEAAAARQKHFAPTALQTRHETAAASNRQLLASVNHGRPVIAATARPGVFKGNGVIAAKQAGAPFNASANRGAAKPMANNAVSRPGNNVSHPGTVDRGMAATHNGVPRPPQTAGRAESPRVENTARPATVARPVNTPHGNMSGAGNSPRPQMESRPAPRTETVAHPPAPRPQAAPRAVAPPPQEHRAPVAAPQGHPEPKHP
jgi:hypothetical protein